MIKQTPEKKIPLVVPLHQKIDTGTLLEMLNKNCESFETGDEGITVGQSCDKICSEQGKVCILTSLSRSNGDDR